MSNTPTMKDADIVLQALNDWVVTYAYDFAEADDVVAARKRLDEFGPMHYITGALESAARLRALARGDGEADVSVHRLPVPDAVVYPDTGFRTDADALAIWAAHMYDTGGTPYWGADAMHSAITRARTAPRSSVGECEWTFDGMWESACGVAWEFNNDGPAENNYRFCHGCGKPIAIAAAPDGGER